MASESSKKRKPKVIRTDGGPQEGKRSRSDVDQDAKYYSEEAEVDLRDPNRDYELYKQTCQDLQKLMAEIQELKSKGHKDSAAEIEERRIQSCVHFMTLKKLNRLAHIRLKKGRDQTHEAKLKVDAYHLQLQNLLYEVMHLQKEITKCLEFKSKHEEIELVSVDEFYKEAPPEISKSDVTLHDPHEQTLSRLNWELEQRIRLAEKYKESLANKEKILKEIEVKKEYLSNLQPRLNSIMQASLPVQEYFAMPFDQVHKQYETARHLPPPLYVLFVQASAYGQACDKKLAVAIEGNVGEARALCKPPEDSQGNNRWLLPGLLAEPGLLHVHLAAIPSCNSFGKSDLAASPGSRDQDSGAWRLSRIYEGCRVLELRDPLLTSRVHGETRFSPCTCVHPS